MSKDLVESFKELSDKYYESALKDGLAGRSKDSEYWHGRSEGLMLAASLLSEELNKDA